MKSGTTWQWVNSRRGAEEGEDGCVYSIELVFKIIKLGN